MKRALTVAAFLSFLSGDSSAAESKLSLTDYRYLRALSIDLGGRIPSRSDLDGFESPQFSMATWEDQLLRGSGYAERMTRVYQDLLRLELGSTFQYVQNATTLRRTTIKGPDGKAMYIYHRQGQRRQRLETDGTFCLTDRETGFRFLKNAPPEGDGKAIDKDVLDRATRKVRPWWLYRDHAAPLPVDRFGAKSWADRAAGYAPVQALLQEPDGKSVVEVRVCAEEASVAELGTVFRSGRARPGKDTVPPAGRSDLPPVDSPYAIANAGKPISCNTRTGYQTSTECGCGVGLKRCLPSPGDGFQAGAFRYAPRFPIGPDAPLEESTLSPAAWLQVFWAEEATHFMRALFAEDGDIREILTGASTWVNGPLTQFYREIAPTGCCGQAEALGYTDEVPLFEPKGLPKLGPTDTSVWQRVDSRGPLASGILTMPIFLTKYGTRRARAHVLWQAFACREFVAEDHTKLAPSSEPDLMKREGCKTCHAALEPLSAYFSRIAEGAFMFLPPKEFPLQSARCRPKDLAKMGAACKLFYDPATDERSSVWLRGAKPDPSHAEAGPQGLAEALVTAEGFGSCVAKQVATSLLGRRMGTEDEAWLATLASTLKSSGYRPKAMVREILRSPRYRLANNERPLVLGEAK